MTAESKGNNQVENLGAIIGGIRPETAAVLDRALSGEDITSEEAVVLFGAEGQEYNAMVMTADELRRRTVGDIVTYVVNRNINFTNVCIKGCGFCAFSRDFREDEGYLLPTEEIIRRAKEAWDYGATEVCVQAGLPRWKETCTSGSAKPSRKNCRTCISMASRRKRYFTAPSGPSGLSGSI
jgi:biotin synthase-like enzyme